MTGSVRIFYFGFCLTVAFAVWLLAYGLGLQLLYGDGRILQATTITTNPFAPFQQLLTYGDSGVLRVVALGALLPAALVAGIVAYAGLQPNSSPLGDARFQTAMTLRRDGWFSEKGQNPRSFRAPNTSRRGRSASPDHRADTLWEGGLLRRS
jgi:type IV secretion system protein VirD4